MQDFKKLTVCKKSHVLAIAVYKATSTFPNAEIYGLSSQVRRACVSIPANIAEGCGRGGGAELNHFLRIAMGSASELEYHLLLARELNFLNIADYDTLNNQVSEVKKILTTLIIKISRQLKTDN